MREQEVRELYEAYLQVHQVQEEEVEELNEGRTTSLSALSRESQKRKDDKKRGRPETESEIHSRLMMGKFRPGASQEERAEGGRQVLKDRGKVPKKGGKDMFEHILEHLVAEGYADTNESALAIMANMSEEWREEILEGLVDAVASGAGTVVGTAQRAAREIPKYVQQKVKNVAGTYEYARQRADANAPSGKMTTNPRSREFSHGNQGGKPAPMKPMKTMRNPGPNFGRG